ncbi:MAG: hypothetical protein SOZ81_08925, partial [Agathobacter sp.]|nr:hypothetical protein [Agathobacter sp.]
TDGVKYSSINEESETNDLLYRTINEHSVSLEKGEKINILAMNGKEYEDVCISLIGQQTTQVTNGDGEKWSIQLFPVLIVSRHKNVI